MIELVIAAIVGYLFGSIPTAYLVVKSTTKKDPRTEGLEVVGTENTLRITGSLPLAILVFFVDVFKGIIGMHAAQYVLSLAGYDLVLVGFPFVKPVSLPVYVAGFFAVVGHCFPMWLGFRGGGGLATSLGVMLAIEPSLILVWLVLFGVGVVFSMLFTEGMRTVPTIFSCVASPVLAYILGYRGLDYYLFTGLCLLILLALRKKVRFVLEGRMEKMFFLERELEPSEEIAKITSAVLEGKDDVDYEPRIKRIIESKPEATPKKKKTTVPTKKKKEKKVSTGSKTKKKQKEARKKEGTTKKKTTTKTTRKKTSTKTKKIREKQEKKE